MQGNPAIELCYVTLRGWVTDVTVVGAGWGGGWGAG